MNKVGCVALGGFIIMQFAQSDQNTMEQKYSQSHKTEAKFLDIIVSTYS